jgi:CDP-2,3-bis-(O-geranylgeranyl)-sn-glycerol synthase
MNHLVNALWLFLPAAIGNAAPVFANKIPGLNRWTTPVDLGKSYQGKRILGDNKTWRGVVTGVIAAGITGYAQYRLSGQDGSAFMWTLVAAVLGFGALYGDAVESFFKRQQGTSSGQTWFPFDQIDYILGGLLAVAPLALFSWTEAGVIIVGYFGLHLVATYIGYLLKLRDRPI